MKHKALMVGAAALTLTLVATACGSSKSSTSAPKELGKGEGALSIIVWAGYAENGSTSPDYDWVTPFEKKNRLQDHGQDRQHVRRHGEPHAVGRVRRGVGIR